MKIGIVGHEDNINRIQAVLREKFEAIEGHPINMHNMSQVNTTVNYIKEHLEDFDGLFFTGKFPYEIINHHMHSQLPSIYLENDESQLQRILLEASLKHHKNIKNITIGNSVSIPITNGRLNLGTWQGIYLGEHRNNGGKRTIVATIHGQTI